MNRTTEETAELLAAARAELAELENEARRIDRTLEEARRADADERLEAARAGGSIAVSSLKSRAREVALRREELPSLVWAARVRALELEVEHLAALVPELEERSDAARAETARALEAVREAEREYERLSDVSGAALREFIEKGQRGDVARRELEALVKRGPEGEGA